jgi:hypothetical protein
MSWLAEELEESHPLFSSVQYITQQSCERRENEMHYKDINRKYIAFDLKDKALMLAVGKTLKPFGFMESLQEHFIHSKIRFFRVWAETKISKRGEAHLRTLYLKQPEKFFNVEFQSNKNLHGKLIKCSYIINEICNVKRVSLNEKEKFPNMMNDFRTTLAKENEEAHHDGLLEGPAFPPEQSPPQNNDPKLIPIDRRSAGDA